MATLGGNTITLQEHELVFHFEGARRAQIFDNETHGAAHCMKAVDFVVEYPEFDLFVEVKDPDDTKATPERREVFRKKLVSGPLLRELAQKYRDSWLYRWAEGRDKPVRYVFLLQLSTLDPALFLQLTDRLKRALPLAGPSSWTRPFVDGVAVMNMDSWNALGAYGSVVRVTDGKG